MQKENYLRNAKLETIDEEDSILDVLENYLPQGYEYFVVPPDGSFEHRIKTPSNDTIMLMFDEKNPNIAMTANILEQDEKNIQPSLRDDELSQLARAISNDDNSKSKLGIHVFASKHDLGIES